jgi:hypothetical protein
MLEATLRRLLGDRIVDTARPRLRAHPPRRCAVDPEHGEASPTLGSLELSLLEPDAAVYTCANDRCGWRRFDRLAPAFDATPRDVAERFTVTGRNDDADRSNDGSAVRDCSEG